VECTALSSQGRSVAAATAGAAALSASADAGAASSGGDAELDIIFEKLHKKDTTQEALRLLYRYKLQHPNADLSSYLSRTSEVFQAYIQRGLKRGQCVS